MASVYVSIGQAMAPGPYGGAPTFRGAVRTEIITSSGSAASGALVIGPNEVSQIFCATAVIASVDGEASASNGMFVPAGTPCFIAASVSGGLVSVIDA